MMERIAFFKTGNPVHAGYWWVTDFTKEQIEGRVANLEAALEAETVRADRAERAYHIEHAEALEVHRDYENALAHAKALYEALQALYTVSGIGEFDYETAASARGAAVAAIAAYESSTKGLTEDC